MASRRKTVTKRIKPYETGLDRVSANFQPLTPLSFLERAAKTFPSRTAIIHGGQRFTYAQFYDGRGGWPRRSRNRVSGRATRWR